MDTLTIGRSINLVGQRFGNLVVLERGQPPAGTKGRNAYWVCQCDCSRQYTVRGLSLTTGKTTRCAACSQAAGIGVVQSRTKVQATAVAAGACPLVVTIWTARDSVFDGRAWIAETPEGRRVATGGRAISRKGRDTMIANALAQAMRKAEADGILPPWPPSIVTPAVWARKCGVRLQVESVLDWESLKAIADHNDIGQYAQELADARAD